MNPKYRLVFWFVQAVPCLAMFSVHHVIHDLTEQIFNTVVVMTTQQPRDRRPTVKGTPFWLKTVSEKALFGLGFS